MFCAWAMAKRFSKYGKEKSRGIRRARRTSRGRREKVNLQAKEGKGKREESEKSVKKEAGTPGKRGGGRNTSSKSARRV